MEVAKAARYILSEACNGIRVGNVVAQSQLTRRILESRFKQQLGKTPHQLIVETRLAKAEELLRESRLTLDQIARNCGIEYAEYLNTLFQKHRGMTPGEYRRLNQSHMDA